MRRIVRVLMDAEKALAQGDENCGGGADNIYHDPLLRVRVAIRKLVDAAPDLDLVCSWAAGEVNHIPADKLHAAVKKVRTL